MANLVNLSLDLNAIGDEGMKAFASAIASGAMAKLTSLGLGKNQIGNEGMQALSSAIANGALPALEDVKLYGNPGSDQPVESALARRNK